MAVDLDPAPILDDIRRSSESTGVRLHLVTRDEVQDRAATESPQGVVARADPLPEADVDELLGHPGAFLVALDGVTDPGNVGAVLRTAEAAGATGAILPKRRSARVSPAVTKAAAGAVEHIPIGLAPGIPATLERASQRGVWAVGLDGSAPTDLFGVALLDQPLMLVLGAEGEGLARLTRERCDVLARIPLQGKVDSLNVSAAAAVACFEVVRARSR